MVEVNLVFEVHGFRPLWAIKTLNTKYSESRYRIYINDDLITERSWVWDNNIMLSENIWAYGHLGSTYKLQLFSVVNKVNQANFSIKNLKIPNIKSEITQLTETEIEYNLINTI